MNKNEYSRRGAARTRWAALRTISRRAILAIVPVLLFISAMPVPEVNAAPAPVKPTLKWINSTTIQVSGGDVAGTATFVTDASMEPGLAYTSVSDISHKDGCKLGMSIDIRKAAAGKITDYSQALVSIFGPDSGTNCLLAGKNSADRTYYNMGLPAGTGKTTLVTNVAARGNEGEPNVPPATNDPEAQQIINVKLNTGWDSVFTTPNPSTPPKADELVPQEDLWVLCGNATEPTKSWDPYRSSTGTADYAKMESDCMARKSGWVITTTRGPIVNSSGDPRYEGKFTAVKAGNYVVCDYITNSCQSVTKKAGQILTVDNWKSPANPNAKVPGAETDANGTVEEPELACDVTFDLTSIFSLKWLVCPVVDTATFAVGKLEDVVNSLLTIDVKDIFDDTAGSNAFHKAWNSFRFFALGLVVVAALIMVVSQAAGVEILDAYTVRKVLPRLLFAAIFIALSWDIIEFLTQLSNDAGQGIRTLIYAPFQALNKDNQLGGGSTFVLALIGTGGALAFGWVGLLSFALTGLLAALVAFAILVFRKMLILLLLMTAPFAIACYILPNTQKMWEVWKGALLSVLIVFPIISAFIAIGRVFAVTSYSAPGNQTINQIIAVIAYFAPYFLISLAFRLAGGFIATVGGFVNDRSRGAFDRLKNFRGNKVNENLTNMKQGRRFSDNNPLARTFNTATLGAGTGIKGRFGFGGRGREARDQNVRTGTAQVKQTAQFKAIQDDDPVLEAATYSNASEAMRGMMAKGTYTEDEARRAIQGVQTSIGFGRPQQIAAAQQLVSTGTGYNSYTDAQGNQVTAAQDMVRTLARASGGNASTASSLAGFANFEAKNKGRHDLAPGYGVLNDAVQREAGTPVAAGPALAHDNYVAPGGLMEATWRSASPVDLIRDRTPGFRNFMQHWHTEYQNARSDYEVAQTAGNQQHMDAAAERARRAETAFYEMEQSRMYGTGENIRVLDEFIQGNEQAYNAAVAAGAQNNTPVTVQRVRGISENLPPLANGNPAPPPERTWLESQAVPGPQMSVPRHGDARRPDPNGPNGHEDPNRMYQELVDPTQAAEARRAARVMQQRQG